jgi:hypothetical protein
MADILKMAEPGNVLTLVMSGTPDQPVYYLLIATKEFEAAHQELRRKFSKEELEQSSQVKTLVEHERLFKQQQMDIKAAMVQALWLDLISSARMLRFALYVGNNAQHLQRVPY